MPRSYDCDPSKRARLARERGFDLLDLDAIFDDPNRLDVADLRRDYGEERRITIGYALDRVFTLVYTIRDDVTWLVTAWPASRRERARYETIRLP